MPVTLLAVDCAYVSKTIPVLEQSLKQFKFANAVFMTSSRELVPAGVQRVEIPCIRSIREYSEFMIWHLPNYIDLFADHFLVVQHDGYIVRPEAWTDRFLKYDYIGAPWPDGRVGNGGFSLRSKKLLKALKKVHILDPHPEDWRICVNYREDLKLKIAPTRLARRFSVECEPYNDSFGFHGRFAKAKH